MPVELQRTLFIGLGGAGIKTILKTKSMFLERFGEVPPCVAFLGIDTDAQEFAASAQEYGISLDAHEAVAIGVHNADDLYRANQDAFSWMPPQNVGALQALSNNGAGQLRSNGRFIFENNYQTIEKSTREACYKVTAATNDGNDAWTLVNGPVQIYLVFSLSGGTGSGIFINMGYLLRKVLGDCCDLQAYAIGPGVFRNCGCYVGANAYGAMLDTDYLMSDINVDNPYVMKNLDDKKLFYTQPPFDLFYLIDNVNKYGITYNCPNQIYTMIGQALFAISGPMGSSIKADLDHFMAFVNAGVMDCEDKKAWTLGLGLCEIMIDTKKLAARFSLQASMNLVSSIIGSNKDLEMTDSAITWINKNNLCEHEADQLLDSLFDFTNLRQSVIASTRGADAKIESDTWIAEGEQEASRTIEANFDEKMSVIKKEISNKLSEIIASGDGLNGAKAFVNCLKTAFEIYAGEMRDELVTLNRQQSGFVSDITDTIFGWPRIFGVNGYKTRLQEFQILLLTNKIDISRHVKASQFYAEIKEYLEIMENEIDKAVEMFGGLIKKFSDIKIGLALKKNDNPFQIDLSDRVHIDGNHQDNTLEKFIVTLNGADILDLSSLQATELMKKVLDFTSSLEGADFSHVSVEELILKMDAEKKQALFNKAMKKAEILLDYQYHGFPNESGLYAYTYVSVPGGSTGALASDTAVTEVIESYSHRCYPCYGPDTCYVPSISPTSIMIYRHKGLYPVFQLETIVMQKREYDKRSDSESFSFDLAVEQKINDEHFGFFPNQRRDVDVLEKWVKGLIFGFIKKEGHRYFVQSCGTFHDYVDNDHWTELECGPEIKLPYENRYHAFNDFKVKMRVLRSTGDLLDKIRSIEAAKGRDELKRLYSEIQNCPADEYVTRYSLVGLEARTINTVPSYYKIKSVMTDELWYVRERLLDSVK